jgi:hypothetical protein
MKIFVSLKVPRGNVELEQQATLARDVIAKAGHEPFIASRKIAVQGLAEPQNFMPFVRQHAATSDLMIVLYHPELRGGMIELGIAYAHKIPIWLCYKSRSRVSSSALGCADLTIEYTDLDRLQEQLSAHLRQFSQS